MSPSAPPHPKQRLITTEKCQRYLNLYIPSAAGGRADYLAKERRVVAERLCLTTPCLAFCKRFFCCFFPVCAYYWEALQ